jgi:MFS family permease
MPEKRLLVRAELATFGIDQRHRHLQAGHEAAVRAVADADLHMAVLLRGVLPPQLAVPPLPHALRLLDGDSDLVVAAGHGHDARIRLLVHRLHRRPERLTLAERKLELLATGFLARARRGSSPNLRHGLLLLVVGDRPTVAPLGRNESWERLFTRPRRVHNSQHGRTNVDGARRPMSVATDTIRTKVPARLDRLPWSRWHWLVVFALGSVWILDGLEVTIKGAVGPSLKSSIGFDTVQVAGSASIYVFGAISGSLIWSWLTDRFGRRRLFFVTMAVYLLGVTVTALTGEWFTGDKYAWFAVGRFITGFGIGGEYAAINSAIDELIPARTRGWVDLAINGSWWMGTAIGSGLGVLYLYELPADIGWRVAFATGGTLAIGILAMRMFVPESPRWLMTHGQADEAERIVGEIEQMVADQSGERLEEPPDEDAIEIRQRRSVGFVTIARTVWSRTYARRSFVGFMLMMSQAWLYNSVFFTFGLTITTFYKVSPKDVGLYIIPFAVCNYLGPLLLGRFFDTVGRRPMIGGTFILTGALTAIEAWLFATKVLTPVWLTVALSVIFFFASAAASAGYLTISETFPLEIRAMTIAFFYSLSTGIGGIIGPYTFGRLVDTGSFWNLAYGYWAVAFLMVVAGVVHVTMGVRAEQRSLENIALPLTAEEAEGGADERRRVRRRRGWSPPPLALDLPLADRDLEREVGLVVRALVDDGPAERRELARRVHAGLWGPGRLQQALRVARREGLARHDRRGQYRSTDQAERVARTQRRGAPHSRGRSGRR